MTSTVSDFRLHAPASASVGPTELVIDRHEEAAGVARFILDAKSRLVVLHGAPDSGKTELITRWVIPQLRAQLRGTGRGVFHGDCGPLFPAILDGTDGGERFEDALRKQNIVIVDDFERVFDLPRDEQRAELDRVFAQLLSSDTKAVVVLVTASQQLNGIYALAAYDPSATSALFELHAMTVEEALSSLGHSQPDEHIEYSRTMLDAVSADCAARGPGWSDTFDLVKLVHTRCLELRREKGVTSVDVSHYNDMGGARGILRAHLERHLEILEAEHEGDAHIARTILERLLDAETTRSVADLSDAGPRIGTSSTEVERVIGKLAEPDGLLRQKPGGMLRVVPPQMLVVIAEDLETRAGQIERAQRIVAEGVRNWLQIGSLLPRQRFEDAHSARLFLTPDEEQGRFLLHCALLHERDVTAGAALYWLRRIKEREDGLKVLLLALVHPIADVRRRSAHLLGEYDEPEVRHRLRIVALADLDPQVRSQAVDSLGRIKTDDVMSALLQEIHTPGSQYRAAAVEALRIFPCADIASVLKQLVNDPTVELPLRETATRVLGSLNIPESVDALLNIALDDEDAEDRQAAAKALASARSDDLNRQIFLRITTTPGRRIWIVRIVLGLIALVGAMNAIVSLRLLANSNSATWIAVIYYVIALIAVIPGGALMMKLRDRRIQLKSSLGVLAVLLFVLNTITIFPLIHGLAHFAVNKRRRAVMLVSGELLGLLFFFTIAPILQGSTLLTPAAVLYQVVGVVLIVGTYLDDVVGVFLGSVLLNRATTLDQRRREIYEQVFTNSDAAKLVFDSLGDANTLAIPSARRLLRKFGKRIPTDQLVTILQSGATESRALASRALRKSKGDSTVRRLESLWGSADESLRRHIASVLLREPNERSIEALGRVYPQTTLVQKVRMSAARWVYRFAVWPRPVRWAAAFLLPTSILLVYDGFKSRSNHAWSQIIALRQDQLYTPNSLKVRIVASLAELYPSEAGPELFEIFKKGRENYQDPLHGAIARALVAIDTVPVVKNPREWRLELLHAVSGYATLLASETATAADSTDSPIALALGVFQSMTNAKDKFVADSASRSLVRFVRSMGSRSDDVAWPRKRAVAALAFGPYQRSLPLLDTLFSQQRGDRFQGGGHIADDLLEGLTTVSLEAYTARLAPDSVDARRQLLVVLRRLMNPPKIVVDDLERLVRDDSVAMLNCDRNGDRVCDHEDEALAYIADHPADEYGYRDLLSHFADTRAYLAADTALVRLKLQYPDEVWARKILAENRHEYLAIKRPEYFQKSYDDMRELRELRSYVALRDSARHDYDRIESDYIEVALSARRYGETDTLAQRLLHAPARSVRGATDANLTTRRLNAALFAYMAYVMKGDRAMAEERLTQLDSVVRALPADFANNWLYPGTEAFITQRKLPTVLEQSLLKLCKPGPWYSQSEAAAVIAENRQALDLLGQP